MELSDTQRGVVWGIAIGLTLSLIGVFGPPFIDALPRPAHTFAARVTFALRWDLLVLICLIGSVGVLARHRFFTPKDIDGSGLTRSSERAQILRAILQNTLEQVVIAVIVHLIWAAAVPIASTASVAVAASLFVVGRVLFWRGYSGGARTRALGFYPSVLMMLALVVGGVHGLIFGS